MSKKEDVVQYIAQTQPLLEKMAEDRDSFEQSLDLKLDSLVKSGSLSSKEASSMKSAIVHNPSSVFSFLEVPTYQYSVGTVKSASHSGKEETDPLAAFALS